MVTSDQIYFYLARHGKAHGPLSWEQICSYMAYGSVKASDLLSVDGSRDWRSVMEWREVVEGPEETAPAETEVEGMARPLSRFTTWFTSLLRTQRSAAGGRAALPRRRIVRYRDWEHVPEEQRSTQILWNLFLGFFFFPPRLWAACSRVFSQHIFRPKADEAGFLKIWPPMADTLCSVLILLSTFWWIALLVLFEQHALPVLRDAIAALYESVQSWMREGA